MSPSDAARAPPPPAPPLGCSVAQQQGNARKAVLDFVAKESVDLLIIGMYKGMCKRKGLGRRGNATTIYNRRAHAGEGLGSLAAAGP
jgi:hypothetical protein